MTCRNETLYLCCNRSTIITRPFSLQLHDRRDQSSLHPQLMTLTKPLGRFFFALALLFALTISIVSLLACSNRSSSRLFFVLLFILSMIPRLSRLSMLPLLPLPVPFPLPFFRPIQPTRPTFSSSSLSQLSHALVVFCSA